MAHTDDLKGFANGGMDLDSAKEYIASNDYLQSFNIRITGTDAGEAMNISNIESTVEIENTLNSGINKCIGIAGFESIRKVIAFIYNSELKHQILEIDYDTNSINILFVNKTDSGNVDVLPLDPQYYVNDIKLINDQYLGFTDANTDPKLIDLIKLRNGEYGVLEAQDFLLIKKQNLPPITGEYGDDSGRVVNLLSNKLFQFISQFVGFDYTYSAWSTWSKRFIPDSESTPEVGTDVTKNNVLVLSVDAGDDRVETLRVGARYSTFDFFTILSVERTYIIALTDTEVDINNGIYEAYDPSTNLYSFCFYNDGLYNNISALETDLPYDYVALIAGAMEVLNGNEIALGDVTEGYDRPTTSVQLSVSSYDPKITTEIPPDSNQFRVIDIDQFIAGTPGNFHVEIRVRYAGLPEEGDVLKARVSLSTDASQYQDFTYEVQASQEGDLAAVMFAWAAQLPNAVVPSAGNDRVHFSVQAGNQLWFLSYATVENATTGSGISKSIHALLDNSSYQLALAYRDAFGRYFPLVTGNEFVVKTQSFAQTGGLTPLINWNIATLLAPAGAVDYQWVISRNNTVDVMLDVIGGFIDFEGSWDAENNTPTLAPTTGVPLDAYEVTTPGTQNLGNGDVSFKTGDFVVYNNPVWDRVDKSIGDINSTSDYLFIFLSPLNYFNEKNSSSILAYEYTPGDRCTFHFYYSDATTKVYFDNPCIDVEVVAYDPSSGVLKIRKSSNVDVGELANKDIYIRIYTPKSRVVTTSDGETENTETLFYEIGERFTITNGVHDTLSGTITDGDVYFKTREYSKATSPEILVQVLATDFNFSDFYISNFNSYGRPRTFTDVLERTERKASIRYSDLFILGSKVNGLTRFYGERIYGDGDGESSSNYGAIRKMVQRNNTLITIQELKVGYIPVFGTIVEDQSEQQQYALSSKILNKIRYNTSGNIGMGNAKESFAMYNNNLYWIDPYRSEPVRAGLDGVAPISGKMSKYFKATLQQAIADGKKIIGFYDIFNNEYGVSIEDVSDAVILYPFNSTVWNIYDDYNITEEDITNVSEPAHGTAIIDVEEEPL